MSTTNKNPGVAAVLSFVIPGLGQIYCERILRGVKRHAEVVAQRLQHRADLIHARVERGQKRHVIDVSPRMAPCDARFPP